MSTASKSSKSNKKTPGGKKSLEAKCAELLTFARALATTGCNWVQANNAIYGPSGKFPELFATPRDRTAFSGSEADKEVGRILDKLPDPPDKPLTRDASGKLLVRMPKSVHAALIAEAEEEGVSLNQLILSKLSLQLKAATSA